MGGCKADSGGNQGRKPAGEVERDQRAQEELKEACQILNFWDKKEVNDSLKIIER